MAAHAITIGPEFFAGAFREYADWRKALAREFAQNSIDCDSDEITVTVTAEGQNTRVVVRNNGTPMDRDTLQNKLLTLGGSGKKFVGTVGGFGQAKHVLYLCHLEYRIRTGATLVVGTGAAYDLTDSDYLHGTESSVLIAGSHIAEITAAFRQFASLAQWDGEFRLNGDHIPTRLHKGARRKDLSFGTVYTNNSAQGLLLVRIAGTPMFTKPISYKGMVLVELNGTSADTLTSNRDGLKYPYSGEVDSFIAEIAVNTKSAFKDRAKKVEKVRFAGYKLAGCCDDEEADLGEAIKTQTPVFVKTALVASVAQTTAKVSAPDAPTLTVSDVERVFRPEFFLKSEIGGKIPSWFLPGGFSDNSKRLITNWIGLLVELASITKLSRPFSVGFIFDPDCVGQYEREAGEHVVYVSPVEIVEKDGKPRQLKVRWSFSAAGNWKLLALAIHEFCHLEGYHSHDEDYAGRLTDLFALVLQHRTRFSRHFSGPIAWPD